MKLCSYTAGPLIQSAVQRIAHATDLTTISENALAWAATLAKVNTAELLLLHVVPPPTPIFETESPLKTQAEFELSVLLTRLKLNGINARDFVLCGTKSIDHQILQATRLEKIDLIVMGTEGRKGISQLLVGSVASRIIARAHYPMLMVPASAVTASSTSRHPHDRDRFRHISELQSYHRAISDRRRWIPRRHQTFGSESRAHFRLHSDCGLHANGYHFGREHRGSHLQFSTHLTTRRQAGDRVCLDLFSDLLEPSRHQRVGAFSPADFSPVCR